MMTPEAKVKKKVKEMLKAAGAYYCMPIGVGYGNSGVPDFIACCNGTFVGIECKAGGNKITALQGSNLRAIQDAGGLSIVVNETNYEELKSLLERTRHG